jgi:hypothetical protein
MEHQCLRVLIVQSAHIHPSKVYLFVRNVHQILHLQLGLPLVTPVLLVNTFKQQDHLVLIRSIYVQAVFQERSL